MSYFEKIRDTVTTEVLKTYLPPSLLLMSTLVVGLVPTIRCTLLLLSPSLLLGLLAISLLGNSGAVAYILILSKKRKELQNLQKLSIIPLRTAFGLLWDENDNPICSICKETPLRPERIGTNLEALVKTSNPFLPNPKLECVKCEKQHPLVDSNGIELSLTEARKRLPKRKAAP